MNPMKLCLVLFLSLLLMISLGGCGGGGGSTTTATGNPPASSSSGGGTAAASAAKLTWDAPTNVTGLAGFKVYYGTSSKTYPNVANVGNVTSYTINGLAPGTYYFATTAYDTSGNESGYSNEVSITVQ
jgi:fibronectin type III domain protein